MGTDVCSAVARSMEYMMVDVDTAGGIEEAIFPIMPMDTRSLL